MKPYVVYWNNIPSPYMVERFNAFADNGEFEFEAWFNDRILPGRSWQVDETTWRFRYRYLPSTRLGRWRLHWPTLVFGKRPDLLVCLYAQPVFLFGWAITYLRGAKTAFWCEVTFDRWVPRRAWKEWLKRVIFPKLDAALGAGEDGRHFAMRYGVRADKALILPHVIDVDYFKQGHARYAAMKDQLKVDMGLVGTTFIYVGRLWWGKGLKYLIDAFTQVQSSSKEETSLLLVGDGPEESKLRQTCTARHLKHVHFAGFRHKDELPRYFSAADIFVFPTLGDPYGLVVDEAMACAMPIICTNAAGEIRSRIEEGVNGYIVPAEDSSTLAQLMLSLVNKHDRCIAMGVASANRIADHTPEEWARIFGLIAKGVLKSD